MSPKVAWRPKSPCKVLRNAHADPYDCGKLNMFCDAHRLLTFPQGFLPQASWIRPRDLAKEGFYLSKDEKSVNCNFCLTEMPKGYFLEQIESISPWSLSEWHYSKAAYCQLQDLHNGNIKLLHTYHNYNYEACRMASLVEAEWESPGIWQHVPPIDLARSAFYFRGPADRVMCTVCHLEIFSWLAEDTAHGEHQKFNAQCGIFQEGGFPDNVPIGEERLSRNGTDSISPTNSKEKRESWMSAMNLSLDVRQKSFNSNWPHHEYLSGARMAACGFFYADEEVGGDLVACYECGLGLKSWKKGDEPKEAHRKYSPFCKLNL